MSFFNKLIEYKNKTPFYTELEYLESTGTQWIDTGFASDSNTYFEVDLQYTSYSTGSYSVMGRASADGINCRMALGQNYSTFYFGIGNQNLNSLSIDTSRHKLYINCATGHYGIDSNDYSGSFTYQSSSNSLYLFARNNNPSPDGFCNCKIYRAKIKNLTKEMDLVPVLDENDVPCMYDQISKKFFYNKGSGQFLYKLAYKRKLIYLQSTGTQYLNSGINAENNLELHFTGHWTNSNRYNNVCGARSSSPYDILSFIMVSADNELGMFYNYHGLEYSTGFLFSQYGSSKHKWISHMYKGEQWVSVDGVKGTVRNINDSCNCQLPLYIFARNQDGTANYFGNIRMYEFKIYKNGEKVLHLIPVLDENDVPCMYDEVTRKLLYNQGSGQFLYN